MRIEWRTKWGLGGGHKCRATGALDEAGKSSLVSGGAEMWRNSISYHPALYIANCLFWKARKKNFPLFRALKPQPTSWVGWGSWLHSESLALRALPVARVHNNNPLAMLSSTTLLGKVMPGRSKVTVSVLTQQNNTRQRRAEPRHPSNPSFLLLGFIQPSTPDFIPMLFTFWHWNIFVKESVQIFCCP